MPNEPSEPKNNSIRLGPVASFSISFCNVSISPLASSTFILATCSFVDPLRINLEPAAFVATLPPTELDEDEAKEMAEYKKNNLYVFLKNELRN